MSVLDLRDSNDLSKEISSLFYETALSSREEFNNFISDFNLKNKSNLDWWSENTSSRNTYASKLFYNFCCIKFVNVLFKDRSIDIDEIVVDSIALKNILEKLIKKKFSSSIKVSLKKKWSVQAKLSFKFLYYSYFFFERVLRIFLARMYFRKNHSSISNKFILVDTFLSQDFIEKDRWYGDFYNLLTKEDKKEILFVPTILSSSLVSTLKIFRQINKSNRNFLVKESYIEIRDLIFAFSHLFRLNKLEISSYFIEDIDICDLIREDIWSNRDVFSIYESIINYKFFLNLSKTDIKISLAINWFEGHCIDQTWNLALKNFFPKVKRIGYQTYRSFPLYLSVFPIESEKETRVIPDTMAVQGEACRKDVKIFLPELNTISVPAFRSKNIWNNHPRNKDISGNILVSLPLNQNTSLKILDIIFSLSDEIKVSRNNFLFLIKPHPQNKKEKLLDKIKIKIPENILFLDSKENFYKLLEKSTLLITEASATCLESLASGVPVIVIKNKNGFFYDPIPSDTPEIMYKICSDKLDLSNAINYYCDFSSSDKNKLMEIGELIKKNYFEPISEFGIKKLINKVE